MRPPSVSNPLRSISALNPLEALWQPQVIIWVVLAGEGLALVLALAPGLDGGRTVYFGLTSLMIQWVSLTTLAAVYLFRSPLSRVRPHFVAYIVLAFLLLATWLVCALAWVLVRDIWWMSQDGWLSMFLRFTAIAFTVGLLGLAAFQNHWRARQLAVRAKQAELEALQARIRPHFLFNTLNTGAALVHQRPEEAERLLLDLSDLFRAALAGPREITLADELALVRRYLEIEGLRFGDRLRVEWQVPVALPDLAVPALSIQPLVENAIRHGVEPVATGGDVHLQVATNGDWLEVTVANALPSAPVRPTTGHQVGLNAVRARIQAMTHGRGSVRTTTAEGRYTAVIRIPLTP